MKTLLCILSTAIISVSCGSSERIPENQRTPDTPGRIYVPDTIHDPGIDTIHG